MAEITIKWPDSNNSLFQFRFVKNSTLLFLFCNIFLFGCDQQSSKLNSREFANKLQLSYRVVDNISAQECEDEGPCFDASIQLELDEKVLLDKWRIYFSHMSPILSDSSDEFDIHGVNGDLHYIEPTAKFQGWVGKVIVDIPFKAKFWHISEFDSPPNFYLVDEEGTTHIIQSTVAQLDSETGQELLPHMLPFTDSDKQFKRGADDHSVWATAERLYTVNNQFYQSGEDGLNRIIPKPRSVKVSNGKLDISNGLVLRKNTFLIDENNPAVRRMKRLGIPFVSKEGIALSIIQSNKIKHQEGYQLIISDDLISILASTEKGAFYGLQSIAALWDVSHSELSHIRISDQPHYSFRGLFIDVARNFRSKEFIVRILDQMAAYKLNKFHFHLADDEGWRLEIPGLP